MSDTSNPVLIHNRVFADINVGDHACIVRTVDRKELILFANVSGDTNPVLLDAEYAKKTPFGEPIAPGSYLYALATNLFGNELPGPGTILTNMGMNFVRPVKMGDEIRIKVIVNEKFERPDKRPMIDFDVMIKNQDDDIVADGKATVIAPTEHIECERIELPEVTMDTKGERHAHLLELSSGLPAVKTAVVYPCDEPSLRGALESGQDGLIVPILVGPELKIRKVAKECGLSLEGIEIIDADNPRLSASVAVKLVREGEAKALMKGSLHTDDLMSEVVNRATGLRTERRISHVFVMEVPTYDHPILITDAAINIEPTLEDKVSIAQNAIDLAKAMGIAVPKVAILAAVETVNPKMRATTDAAALCKMADRGQIKGGLLDGPLAFDNAISREAAKTKGITGPVAGNADILLVPDLEAGNMVAKQLEYLANAVSAGIVLGAKCPIILTSRADTVETRKASASIAKLLASQED